MTRYATWIKSITPSGTFAIGADAYRARLRYEDALDMPLDQYLAVGERALEETRAQFVATAKQIDPNATPQQVYASITKVHPPPGALLDTATSDLVKLRAFVEAKQLVTLPPDANIKVVETPPFERLTITAAEDSPGPLETVATQSYYYVTPVDETWSAETARGVPLAVQRLRLSHHLGARSLSRATSPTSRSTVSSTSASRASYRRVPSSPKAGRTTANR